MKGIKETLFWHDYETFGIDPQLSNVAQFAGIRTDLDLNIIEDPVNIICRPTLDRLPSPEACMITGISPLVNKMRGMTEVAFFQKINNELSRAGTCGIGYNSINFDDEVTRNGLYRNFIDPYQREWKDGCSKWDLLNVLRIVDALKPNTIIIPIDPLTNKKVFKLDQLSLANGIEHENAHDALSDVIATIELAKIIKNKEPELFLMLFNQRKKDSIEKVLFENQVVLKNKPFIMAESFFGNESNYIEILYPIAFDKPNVYCIKLTKKINSLLELKEDEIKENAFKKKENMVDGEERMPLHTLKMNKCPIILPIDMIDSDIALRLNISGDVLRENLKRIKENKDELKRKVKFAFTSKYESDKSDVDLEIYNGFFEKNDKMIFEEIKSTESVYLLDYLKDNKKRFKDPRVEEMLFRYICRNYDDALDNESLEKWNEFCKKRITDGIYSLTFEQYFEKIEELSLLHKDDPQKMKLIKDLILFGKKTREKLM